MQGWVRKGKGDILYNNGLVQWINLLFIFLIMVMIFGRYRKVWVLRLVSGIDFSIWLVLPYIYFLMLEASCFYVLDVLARRIQTYSIRIFSFMKIVLFCETISFVFLGVIPGSFGVSLFLLLMGYFLERIRILHWCNLLR